MAFEVSKNLTGLIKGILHAIVILFLLCYKYVFKYVTKFVTFFALWIPGSYLIYGALLRHFFGFSLASTGLNKDLYMYGLYACLALCLVLTIRHILAPDKEDLKDTPTTRTRQFVNKRERIPQPEYQPQPIPQPVYNQPAYVPAPNYQLPPLDTVPTMNYAPIEQPLVYYSKRNPELLIYEYSDRYDIYRDDTLWKVEPKRR